MATMLLLTTVTILYSGTLELIPPILYAWTNICYFLLITKVIRGFQLEKC